MSDGFRGDMLRKAGIDVHIVGDLTELRDYLSNNKYDIVHIHRLGISVMRFIDVIKQIGNPVIIETSVFGGYQGREEKESLDHAIPRQQIELSEEQSRVRSRMGRFSSEQLHHLQCFGF